MTMKKTGFNGKQKARVNAILRGGTHGEFDYLWCWHGAECS